MDTDVRNMADTEVKVPDIGDFKDVPIIEIHVQEGQSVNADDPIITLESDKATMDVPSPASGTVEKLLVKVGDKVSEGDSVLRLPATRRGRCGNRPPCCRNRNHRLPPCPPRRRPRRHRLRPARRRSSAPPWVRRAPQ